MEPEGEGQGKRPLIAHMAVWIQANENLVFQPEQQCTDSPHWRQQVKNSFSSNSAAGTILTTMHIIHLFALSASV